MTEPSQCGLLGAGRLVCVVWSVWSPRPLSMPTYNVQEAKTRLSELLGRVERGEEIVIAVRLAGSEARTSRAPSATSVRGSPPERSAGLRCPTERGRALDVGVTYLLDTDVLWLLVDPARIPDDVHHSLADRSNTLLVSAISGFEITKVRIGKPDAGELPTTLASRVAQIGPRNLPVTIEHALFAGSMPWSHRNPFDRLLASQATLDNLTLVTVDSALVSLPAMLVLTCEPVSARCDGRPQRRADCGSDGQHHPVAGATLVHRGVRFGSLGERALLDHRTDSGLDGELQGLLDLAGRAGGMPRDRQRRADQL